MKPNLKRLTYFVVIVALFALIPTMGITASAHQEEPSAEGGGIRRALYRMATQEVLLKSGA